MYEAENQEIVDAIKCLKPTLRMLLVFKVILIDLSQNISLYQMY
mgnify:CR=1 FL=1